MRISRCWTLVALMLCGAVVASPAEDREALRQIKEVDWPKAYREQDTQLLDRLLAEEFQSIDAEGAWSSKAAELDYIRKNKPTYESFRFAIKRMDLFENNTAVVAGTGLITEKSGDRRVVTEYQSTNIFIKRAGRWQAIASHISGIKEQARSSRE